MSKEEVQFVPYEIAEKIISAVMEEEHIQEPDRRILTVYDMRNKELCWFDHDEIMAEVEPKTKEAAVEHIMHHIPVWAVEDLIRELEKAKKS